MMDKCNPTFDSALLVRLPLGHQRRIIYLAFDSRNSGKIGIAR